MDKTTWMIHNRCNYPMQHAPSDLCYWESLRDPEGLPYTVTYQDDGFGNLVRLSDACVTQKRRFIYDTRAV